MKGYLLDTNQVSAVLEGNNAIYNRIAAATVETVAVPLAVCGELFYMAYHSTCVVDNVKRVRRLLTQFRVIAPDMETAELFAQVKQEFVAKFGPKKPGARVKVRLTELGLQNTDLWIASTAIQYGLVLVSCDRHFERIQQVRHFDIETWWRPGDDVAG